MQPSIQETLEFVQRAHLYQAYGNQPYWTHCQAVAEFGLEFFRFEQDAYVAALLHDVLEDTEYTRQDLEEMGYSAKVLDAVELLTKDSSLSYAENIDRIVQSKNRIAMMVKFADNFINLTGDKKGWPRKRVKKLNTRYEASMKTLAAALSASFRL